jgi:hypothetical protein
MFIVVVCVIRNLDIRNTRVCSFIVHESETREIRMGETWNSEGVEHEVLLQGKHDGHVTFLANQILYY